jgi:glycosyltransferase involved in cell wall biosynthesis
MDIKNSLSVVLPAYNEEGSIARTVKATAAFLKQQNEFKEYEIIVVDDGSTDQTAGILKKLKDVEPLKVITHPANLGFGGAVASGIKQARFSWLLLMDSDGQFKIDSIQKFTEYLSEYEIIAGYRNPRADAFYRELLGKTYTFLACRLFGLMLRDINCGFKMFKKESLRLNGAHYHAGVFYTNIFIKAKRDGYRIKEVPVDHYPRTCGKQTGANFDVVFKAVMDLGKLIFARNK